MAQEVKRWQANIWINDDAEPVKVYGEFLAKLPAIVADWLRENQPSRFSNMRPNSDSGRWVTYRYYDGAEGWTTQDGEPLDVGWYYVPGAYTYARPQQLKGFEDAVSHFTKYTMVTEKGPDYEDFIPEEGNFLHLLKTIRRESNEARVNDLLQRGWVIISMEYEVQGKYPEESQRKTAFVLGHPEEGAI